jgi:Flp pilus assembly protein TadG
MQLENRNMSTAPSRRTQRGQALVEVAAFVPFLLFLTIGLIDVGKYTYYAIQVNNAARAGAAYGAQNSTTAVDTTGIQTAASNDASALTSLTTTSSSYCVCASGGGHVTCNPLPTCANSHSLTYVTVTSTETFNVLFKMPWLPNTLAVSGTSLMRVSQ